MTPAPSFPERDAILQIAFAYPYEADRVLFGKRPPWVVDGRMSLDDVYDVISWKSPRLKSRLRRSAKNNRADIPSITSAALGPFASVAPNQLDYEETKRALEGLSQIDLINTRTASAILAVFRPELFTVLDWRAFAVLVRYGTQGIQAGSDLNSHDTYVSYLKACHRLSRQCGVSLRNLDRFLWVLGGTEALDHEAFLDLRASAIERHGW